MSSRNVTLQLKIFAIQILEELFPDGSSGELEAVESDGATEVCISVRPVAGATLSEVRPDSNGIPDSLWEDRHFAIWRQALPDQYQTARQLLKGTGLKFNSYTRSAIKRLLDHGCLRRRKRGEYIRGREPQPDEVFT